MPTPLSSAERRLRSFCRFFGAAYLAGAAVFAFAPGLTYRLASLGNSASLGPEALFWNALAASMMVASGTACFVVARAPRTLRHALLPVVLAKLTSTALGIAHFGAGKALGVLVLTDLPIFTLTLFVYRAAAPGVHAMQAAPVEKPPEGVPAPVQLGMPK